MTFSEELLPEFDQEMASTRRVLERVPDDKPDWKPHPKSFSLAHLANIAYRVGRKLKFDGKSEKFVGDAEADKLLTREYRAPFVVPEKV